MKRTIFVLTLLVITTFAVVAIIGYAAGREGMTKAQLIVQIQKNWDEILGRDLGQREPGRHG